MQQVAKRITVHGRVQGVGFRAFVAGHASRLGLDGFVRNRKDGTVDVLCVGVEEEVSALIGLCHEGPPASQVEHVAVEDAKGIVDKGFVQKPTV